MRLYTLPGMILNFPFWIKKLLVVARKLNSNLKKNIEEIWFGYINTYSLQNYLILLSLDWFKLLELLCLLATYRLNTLQVYGPVNYILNCQLKMKWRKVLEEIKKL